MGWGVMAKADFESSGRIEKFQPGAGGRMARLKPPTLPNSKLTKKTAFALVPYRYLAIYNEANCFFMQNRVAVALRRNGVCI